MKKYIFLAVLPALFVLMLFALYIVNINAPVYVLAMPFLQLPFIFGVAWVVMGKNYAQRAEERRAAFVLDGDARAWLKAEEEEAGSFAFRYWPSRGKALSALNRADAAFAAGQSAKAASLLTQANPGLLTQPEADRHLHLLDILAALPSEQEKL